MGYLSMNNSSPAASSTNSFPQTLWTQVEVVGRGDPTGLVRNLLLERYYEPIHAWLCRKGFPAPVARDLTHDFLCGPFTDLCRTADPARGKFRSYVFKSFGHWHQNQKKAANAQKRGGDVEHEDVAEIDPAGFTYEAGRELDRELARDCLAHTRRALLAGCKKPAAVRRLTLLWAYLAVSPGEEQQKLLCRDLTVTPEYFSQILHRLRNDFSREFKAQASLRLGVAADDQPELIYLLSLVASDLQGPAGDPRQWR